MTRVIRLMRRIRLIGVKLRRLDYPRPASLTPPHLSPLLCQTEQAPSVSPLSTSAPGGPHSLPLAHPLTRSHVQGGRSTLLCTRWPHWCPRTRCLAYACVCLPMISRYLPSTPSILALPKIPFPGSPMLSLSLPPPAGGAHAEEEARAAAQLPVGVA